MSESAFPPLDIVAPEAVESYYLETGEGLYFAVKGLEHPPDRWIAVLRYLPDPKMGTREKDGKFYRRLYGFKEQEQWIEEVCPQYRAYDHVFRKTLQSVPRSQVRNIYNPRHKLHELTQATVRGGLEEDVVAFSGLLEKEARVPASSLGITGSVLIGVHAEHSDIDIVVFGEDGCRKVHQALSSLLADPGCKELRRLDAKGMEELYDQRVVDSKMEYSEFVYLEKQKVNQGIFRDRPYFIRFIKEPFEAEAGYGQLHYTSISQEKIQAAVVEDRDAIFTPCRYGLSGTQTTGKKRMPDLNEIVSFRGRFCDQARIGDRILATGTLEQVQDGQGVIRYRLLLGNSREDTMVVMR
jgi:predicted nucleotidyltransferase